MSPSTPLRAAALLLTAGLAVTACSQDTSAGDAAAPAAAAADDVEQGSFVFLPKSLNNPYWVDAREGMEAAAQELGVEAQFLGPEADDVAEQVAIFESVLATQPAGIAISPNDPASVRDVIARAREAGVPVIAWDGPVPDSEVQGYIGTDNVAAGRQAGEALAEAMGGSGTVAVVTGSLSATNLNQRLEGVQAALEEFPDIEVVATEESGESIAQAQTRAETLLQANPDLSAMVGIGGSDLPGIAGALTAAGRCGDVAAVGFDVVDQGVEAMRAGCVDALISQRPYGMTSQALEVLQQLSEGTFDQEDGFSIDTGVETVQPDGLEDFLADAPH